MNAVQEHALSRSRIHSHLGLAPCSGIGVVNPPWLQLMDTPLVPVETEMKMSRDGVTWARRVRGLTRPLKRVLVLVATHEGDNSGPFGPDPGELVVESGLPKRRFDSCVRQLQKRGLIALELRLVGGVRRNWYQLKRQGRTGADVGPTPAEQATGDLFHDR